MDELTKRRREKQRSIVTPTSADDHGYEPIRWITADPGSYATAIEGGKNVEVVRASLYDIAIAQVLRLEQENADLKKRPIS